MKSLLKKKSYGLPERFTSIGNDKCGVPGWGKYLWLTQIFLAGKEKRERCRRTQGWVILERNLEYLRIFIVVKIQVDPPPRVFLRGGLKGEHHGQGMWAKKRGAPEKSHRGTEGLVWQPCKDSTSPWKQLEWLKQGGVTRFAHSRNHSGSAAKEAGKVQEWRWEKASWQMQETWWKMPRPQITAREGADRTAREKSSRLERCRGGRWGLVVRWMWECLSR